MLPAFVATVATHPLAFAVLIMLVSIFMAHLLLKKAGLKLVRGDVVLITGAGSGIGRQLATDIAPTGADIVLMDIDLDAVEETRARIQKALPADSTGELWCVQCDVSSEPAITQAAERLRAQMPKPVTVLVNNAGVVSGKRLLDADPAAVTRTLAVNALAPMWLTRAFLPDMLSTGRGAVVGMASTMGLVAAAQLTDYCASKWAHVGFMEALRHELQATPGGKDILAITVCPFAVSTGMFHGIYSKHDSLLRRWLLPLLTAKDVSAATLGAIRSGAEFVVVPWYFDWLIPVFRLLPVGVYNVLAGLAGAHRGMSGFVGRRANSVSQRNPLTGMRESQGHSAGGAADVQGGALPAPGPANRARRRSGRAAPVKTGGGEGIYTKL